jgi:hypothetical protein
METAVIPLPMADMTPPVTIMYFGIEGRETRFI